MKNSLTKLNCTCVSPPV